MSTATAADAAPAPAAGGKKKLIIIVVIALLVLVGGGAAAFMLLKKHPQPDEGADAGGHAEARADTHAGDAAPRSRAYDPKHPPVFVPLEAFTVNLADRDADRYAQIGVTLEIDDAKVGDELKNVMPAVRNNILMVLSNKTASELLTREGKENLARAILRAAVRPLGFVTPFDDDDEEQADTEESTKKKKKRRRAMQLVYPVTAVHFSTFIVQ